MVSMENAALVLEGGGMRGLYTVGVTDCLLEHGILIKDVYGVSAGACQGCNYLAGQVRRGERVWTGYLDDKRYCSVQSLLNTGNLFNAMFCYHTVPNELDKFDRERYNADKTPFYVVCTDAETGEPVYHLLDRANDWGFEWIRASASLPLVSKPVKIDGKYYLDGGMSDSIPIEFMIVGGCEKNVVVLTQPRDYVKEKASMLPLMKLSLRKYPYTYDAILHRHIIYNDSRARVFQEEKLGNAVVICPKEKLPIDRVEHDPEVMEKVYQLGRQAAEEKVDELRAFFNEAKR